MRLISERERLSGMFDTAGCSSSVDKLDHGQEYWEKGGVGGFTCVLSSAWLMRNLYCGLC